MFIGVPSARPLIMAIASALALSTCVEQRHPAPDEVACEALKLYRTGGVATLVASSQHCWSQRPIQARCIYLDTAAHYLDLEFSGSRGLGAHPYFEEPVFLERSRPYFDAAGMDMEQANSLLSDTHLRASAVLEGATLQQTSPAMATTQEGPQARCLRLDGG